MIFLPFEDTIETLHIELERIQEIQAKGKIDLSASILDVQRKITEEQTRIYTNLTGWQKVQVSRHPERLYTLDYIEKITTNFTELHGDRNVKDDKAIIGGFATIDNNTVMIVGHQKGNTTKLRQYRNFGMANPEGYRKANRLFKLAEKFQKPIITFIDTPGAFPGIEGEERGQAEAIARNIQDMFTLTVPIICVVIGEGASGGAIGIGIGDKVLMQSNTWYSVISPESCSSILWKSWDQKEKAAQLLKLSANEMLQLQLIDGIIPEPIGGVHANPTQAAEILKQHLITTLQQLKTIPIDQLIQQRIQKFCDMGVVNE
jgi:acetyl-CoA carboxylase carboxyl transferase subunit alpha